jgi:hypothetical protein
LFFARHIGRKKAFISTDNAAKADTKPQAPNPKSQAAPLPMPRYSKTRVSKHHPQTGLLMNPGQNVSGGFEHRDILDLEFV